MRKETIFPTIRFKLSYLFISPRIILSQPTSFFSSLSLFSSFSFFFPRLSPFLLMPIYEHQARVQPCCFFNEIHSCIVIYLSAKKCHQAVSFFMADIKRFEMTFSKKGCTRVNWIQRITFRAYSGMLSIFFFCYPLKCGPRMSNITIELFLTRRNFVIPITFNKPLLGALFHIIRQLASKFIKSLTRERSDNRKWCHMPLMRRMAECKKQTYSLVLDLTGKYSNCKTRVTSSIQPFDLWQIMRIQKVQI